MAKVSTSITIDSDVKLRAQALFADLGLDLSTAINIFLRQAIRENGIPFTVQRSEPLPDVEPEDAEPREERPDKSSDKPAEKPAKPSKQELPKGYKSFTDIDEMVRDLIK